MDYNLGKTKFKSNIWIKGGELFEHLGRLEIEMLTAGTFAVEVYSAANARVGRDANKNEHGGWHTFDFQNGGAFGPGVGAGKFKVKLVNESPNEIEVRGGTLSFG